MHYIGRRGAHPSTVTVLPRPDRAHSPHIYFKTSHFVESVIMTEQRIITHPKTAEGCPFVQGTTVTVHQILTKAAEGVSSPEIVSTFPELALTDVTAAFAYAAALVDQQTNKATGKSNFDREERIDQGQSELDLHKILVVDDTPLNLEFMRAIFAMEKEFTLSVASNGAEGLAKARTEAPFLILSDIQMPGMSGLKLCQEIKADPRTKNAALIFITAFGQNTNLVSKGLNMGADDFISQPFERDELLARVRAVARLKRAELEAQRQAQIVAQRNQGLELLNELAVATTSSLNLQHIFASAMQQLSLLLSAEGVSILVIDKDSQELTVNIASQTGDYFTIPVKIENAPEITELTLQKQIPGIISDILKDPTYNQIINPPPDKQAVISVPMVSQEGIIGAIAVINKRDGDFTSADWSLLISAVSIITVAVENARLFAKVQGFNRRLEQKVRERTRELNQEKKKVEAILVSMADGVIVLDDEGHISTINTSAQNILGVELDKLLGVSIESSQLTGPLWAPIRQLVNSPEPTASISVDVPDATKLDGILSLQANSAAVRNEVGHTMGTVIVLNDVTAIIEVERMKARFMAGVTHELKTPLAVIKLQTNNLVAYHTRLPENKRNDMLKSIQSQVKLLEELIEDILELSRFDSSLSKLEREPTDLVAIIDEVIAESQPLAAAKGLTLHCEKSGPAITIEADANKLNWLIGNLVDNAVKYTLNGSIKVKVGTKAVNGQAVAVIQVADTGIGIPPEEHNRIFERFYRVDSSHTIPGTGLGLSIVKEIAEAHGGEVRVESPPQGGSVFMVTLPEK